MTVFDAGIIAIILFFVARGAWIGIIRQLVSIATMILGFVVAGRYAGQAVGFLAPAISSPRVAFILTYILLLLLTYVVLRLLGLGLRKVLQISFLTWFDRLAGGVMGFGKGAILAILIFMLLAGMSTAMTPILQQSFLTPYLSKGSLVLLACVRERSLRELFHLRAPAISASFPVPIEASQPFRPNPQVIGQEQKLIPQGNGHNSATLPAALRSADRNGSKRQPAATP